MITRDRWQMTAQLKYEAEADRIEREHLNPQLERGEFYQRGDVREVAMVQTGSIPGPVVDVLMKRAKEAGWRPFMGPNGYFVLAVP